jgi:hypothetical protein
MDRKKVEYKVGDTIILKNNPYALRVKDIVISTQSIYYCPLACYVYFKLAPLDIINEIDSFPLLKMKMDDFTKILDKDLIKNYNVILYVNINLVED